MWRLNKWQRRLHHLSSMSNLRGNQKAILLWGHYHQLHKSISPQTRFSELNFRLLNWLEFDCPHWVHHQLENIRSNMRWLSGLECCDTTVSACFQRRYGNEAWVTICWNFVNTCPIVHITIRADGILVVYRYRVIKGIDLVDVNYGLKCANVVDKC